MSSIHPLVAISDQPKEEFWFEIFVGAWIYCTMSGFLFIVTPCVSQWLNTDVSSVQHVTHDPIHNWQTTALQHVSLRLHLITAYYPYAGGAAIAPSVERFATGWTVRGSKPGRGRDFPHQSKTALGPPIRWVPDLSRR